MRAKILKQLIELVEQSNIGELEITRWGTKVRISKTGAGVVVSSLPGHPAVPAAPVPVPVPAPNPAAIPAAAPVAETVESENFLKVKAPMVGTFYAAPSPEADPFVKVGDSVQPGKILCIIEAMKLMNEIDCEVSGKIVKILVENGTAVDFNQPLFLIEPA